jgi:hypothetical protein
MSEFICTLRRHLCLVIAGLDPAIHRVELTRHFLMDARVKPAHDDPIGLA